MKILEGLIVGMRKSKRIIEREVRNGLKKYLVNIRFEDGSNKFNTYVKGYYMVVNELDNLAMPISEAKVKILLIETDEESEDVLQLAIKVSVNYEDMAILTINIKKDELRNNALNNTTDKKEADMVNTAFDDLISQIKENGFDLLNDNNKTVTKDSSLKPSGSELKKCKYYVEPSDVKFDDIAGLKEVKMEVNEAISMFKEKEKYKKMGVTTKMNNILLSGSAGSGKTLIAKAISTELDYPLFQASGEFSDKYVGQTAKNVKTLFEEARRFAPSIIFIDEAEQICRQRTGESDQSERESGTSELLNQLDGFKTTDDIIVIFATNLPKTIDDAVLRRMSKKIHITNPDFETRKGILEVNARNKPMDKSCDLSKIARNLSGFNGGTIANIMNQAGILAVRRGLDEITQTELEDAFEREVTGLKSETKKLNERDKEIVSYHEISHAILTYMLKSEKIQKISILPTTGDTLGYCFYAEEDEDDRYLETKEEMLNDIIVSLGGRAGEEVKFGKVTGGCHNDIEHATAMAEYMVTKLGMYDEFGLASIDMKSIFMQEKVFKKVNEILGECYKKAVEILEENRILLDALSKELIDKEVMTLDDFMRIYESVTLFA
ncbi:MAG: AAA family ATPase [Bacilli bacterium]